MDRKRSIIRVGLVLFMALGAGHIVQNMQKNLPENMAQARPGLRSIEQVSARGAPRITRHGPANPAAAADDPARGAAATADQPLRVDTDS